MNKIRFILTTLVLFFCVSAAMAQSRRITGTVYDDMGGIMMANVVERDKENRIVEACVTDINGNFSMVIKNPKNKLVISYIGYKTWSQVIGTTTKFNIKLQENTQLQEGCAEQWSDHTSQGNLRRYSDHEHGRRGRSLLRLCRRSSPG